MSAGIRILTSSAPANRLGQLMLVGEVVDAEPSMQTPLRVMDDHVLSVVTDGEGCYRHADGSEQPIAPGTITTVRSGTPHWYGTTPGGRWNELFAVFTGPLFDTLADVGIIAADGPRRLGGKPSIAALRTVLTATVRSRNEAEHQLVAIADWLVDATVSGSEPEFSPPIAVAAEMLSNDLTATLDLASVAAEVGLGYGTLRRRFTAEIGQPPIAFRNTHRLQAAATLLRMTDKTIRHIAHTLGYVDEFHLSRRFRAHFGVWPRDYRRS